MKKSRKQKKDELSEFNISSISLAATTYDWRKHSWLSCWGHYLSVTHRDASSGEVFCEPQYIYREREKKRERESEQVCVCVCVCVWERERERVKSQILRFSNYFLSSGDWGVRRKIAHLNREQRTNLRYEKSPIPRWNYPMCCVRYSFLSVSTTSETKQRE